MKVVTLWCPVVVSAIIILLSYFAQAQSPISVPFKPGDGIGVDGPWPYISLPISKCLRGGMKCIFLVTYLDGY